MSEKKLTVSLSINELKIILASLRGSWYMTYAEDSLIEDTELTVKEADQVSTELFNKLKKRLK